jgi:hypothetical protein
MRMGNTQAGDPEAPAEAPAETPDEAPAEATGEPDETYERSLGWYATVVAITTGIFCALLAIGLTLLPTATLDEKSLVIGACLALAAASFIGVGAWQSARRFAATATVTALAIVSLAVLSIAADLSGAGGGQADGPLSGPSTEPGSSTPQSSAPSGSVYLSSGNLPGDPGQGQPGPGRGTYPLGGTGYVSSLGYASLCRLDASGPLKVTYPLGGPYRYLTAELGLTDGYPQKGQSEQATFEVDEIMNNGSSKDDKQVTVHYGHPVRFIWNIEGAADVTLLTHGSDCITGSVAVWGSVRLVPLP